MTDNEHEGMKKCSKCGEIKPATAEYFNRNRTKKDGLRVNCKECEKEYRQKNIEYHREYRQKNKDRFREYHREYRQKNIDKLLAYRKEYYQKNKDRKREYGREYYQKNKYRFREYSLEYYQKNKDRKLEYSREYARAPVGRFAHSIYYLRRKTGATIYVRDMTEEQKETLANQYVAIRTLEKTEKEMLAASGKKRCPKCGGVFDFDMFHKSGGRSVSYCKACANESLRKYRQNKKNKKALDKIESIPDNRE